VVAKVKQEYAPEGPSMYGIRPVEESDDVETRLGTISDNRRLVAINRRD